MRPYTTDEQNARPLYKQQQPDNTYKAAFQSGNQYRSAVSGQQNSYQRMYSSSPSSHIVSYPPSSSHQSPGPFAPMGRTLPPVASVKPHAKSSLRLVPFEGWLALLLLGVALYCVVESIIAAQWVNHSGWLLLSPIVGLLVGLLVAKMPRFPQAILHLGACLVGHWLSIWLTSTLAFNVSWTLVLGDLRAAFTGDFVTLGAPASEIIFFFYLSFLCFFLGYFGSWLVYRAHLPWLVALVYISIMLVNLNYVKQDMSYLIVFMVAALLLLIARMQLTIQVTQWMQEGLHTDRQWLQAIKKRCMQAACIIVLLTLFLGWFLPIQAQNGDGKAFWDHLNTAWTDAVNGHFSWQDLTAFVTSGGQTNFFGDQLTISDTVHLPTGEVLRYQSTDGQNTPHYLEGFTLNTFDGRTWTSSLSDTRALAYQANDLLPVDTTDEDQQTNGNQSEEHIKISITLPPDGTKNYIFAPANPRVFSVPTIVYDDGTAGAWTQQKPLSTHEVYEVTFVPAAVAPGAPGPVPSLSMADENRQSYGLPAQYFQVPANIDPQVKQTMLSWTHGATDTYTALKLLEKHLSDPAVFTYSLDNQPIPDNTDVISWLLKTRRGYCTYYATAMAIMGRMLNIPTRIVNGFSQGVYENGQWVVDGGDAHSWVQAFFPNYGWINFDPTPGFAPNALPVQQAHTAPTPVPSPTKAVPTPTPKATAKATPPASAASHPNNPSSPSATLGGNSVLWVVLAIVGLFLALVLFCVAIVRYWWSNLYRSSPLISALYWRFCRVAGFFGLAPRSSQTPYEYSYMIGQRFPQQANSFWRLTDLFVREHWGGPQQRAQAPNANEVEVKYLWPSLRSLLVNLFTFKFKRKSSI
jgi:transglutaminase-like putative cysteine protease